MRKRSKCILIRLNEDEILKLKNAVKTAGISQEAYVRSLINGYLPKQKPPNDFLETIKQLRRIGNNLSQLAMIAHKTGSIDIIRYKRDIAELNENILEIRKKVLLPEENSDGND